MQTQRLVQVWHLIWERRLGEAWRIWVCPGIVLHAYAAVLLAFFFTLNSLIEGDSDAAYFLENMLVFALGGPTLATLYFIMGQYEKLKQVKIRRWTRILWWLLVGAYALYTFFNVSELTEQMQHAGAH